MTAKELKKAINGKQMFKLIYNNGRIIVCNPTEIGEGGKLICSFFIGTVGIPVANGILYYGGCIGVQNLDFNDYCKLNIELVKHGFVFNKENGKLYKKGEKEPFIHTKVFLQ